MTSRRAPDGANRLSKNAQQSAFGGALDGHLRSARPTKRRNIPGTPNTSHSPTGGGQIFTVASGVTDVGPGDFLMDMGGMLWWKDYNDNWTHLFSGDREYGGTPTTYHPTNAGVGTGSDLFLGWENGYTDIVPTSGAGNVFLGQSNLAWSGSGAVYTHILGHDNVIETDIVHGMVSGHWNNLHGPGSQDYTGVFGHQNEVEAQGESQIDLHGSFSEIHGEANYISILGRFNEIVNETSVGLYNIVQAGQSNSVFVYEAWPGFSVSNLGAIGFNVDYQFSSDASAMGRSFVVGMDSTIIDASGVMGFLSSMSISDSQYFMGMLYGAGISNADYGVAIGYGIGISAPYTISVGSFNSLNAQRTIALGYDLALTDELSWALGYAVSTVPATEEGYLVAKSVVIRRSDEGVGGDPETSLSLDDTAGDPHILTVDTSGDLLVDGSPISGGGGATGFDYTNGTASTTWTITHNLGYYPNVQCFDTAGDVIAGDINHVDVNECVVTFLSAVDGGARLI